MYHCVLVRSNTGPAPAAKCVCASLLCRDDKRQPTLVVRKWCAGCAGRKSNLLFLVRSNAPSVPIISANHQCQIVSGDKGPSIEQGRIDLSTAGAGTVDLRPPIPTAGAPLPPGTRLRLATVADAPGLAKVFVSAWRSGYVGIVDQPVLDALDEVDIADWLRTIISSGGPATWAVESADGEILAFSRYGEDPADTRRGHIYSLYVAPPAGGRGIAKALLDHDLRLLAERGLNTVTLWVFEHNVAARSLYSSFGFLPDGALRVEPQYGAQEVRLRRAAAHYEGRRLPSGRLA